MQEQFGGVKKMSRQGNTQGSSGISVIGERPHCSV